MADMTHLYILVFPLRGIIKIGKADAIHERIQSLKRWWGEVDYEASYHLLAPSDLVFRLEKSLHFLLSKYSVQFDEGDGRTELFSQVALDTALKHIDLFCSSGAVEEPLRRGVSQPPLPVLIAKPQRGRYTRYEKKNLSMVASVTRIAEKFSRINRLLIVLLRKQKKLAYQYDILDGHVYFRLRLPSTRARVESEKVMQLISFNIEDFNGFLGVNCCSVTYVEGVIQYSVRLIHAEENGSPESLLYYFSRQSEHLLTKLPKRSQAAQEEISMLDESKVWDELMARYGNSAL